jgi:hypothetical protein
MNTFEFATGLAITGASLLLVGGSCATVRPDFEKTFISENTGLEYQDAPSHAEWMRFVATRYGCDTMAIRTGVRSFSEMGTGAPPCDIASRNPPEVVRAWKTPRGLREEWRFGSGGRRMSVYFEGPSERALISNFIQWW